MQLVRRALGVVSCVAVLAGVRAASAAPCTDATCEPFPNTPERLPLLEADGALPPIP